MPNQRWGRRFRLPRAIIFDLDGVLIDSASCHRAAFEEVFLPFGIRDFDYPRYAGWRTPEVVESVLERAGLAHTPALIAEVSDRKSRLAREKIASHRTDPDCLTILEKLASRYVLGLASSGSKQSVELFLTSHHCRHIFQSVLSGDSVTLAKPDPEIYSRSFAALGIPPLDGIVVEDAIAGIHAAKAAGTGAVIGMSGTSPDAALLEAGVWRVIARLSELPELLETRHGDQQP